MSMALSALAYNADMTKHLVLALAMVAAGISAPGRGGRIAAQGGGPCALVTTDDVQPLAQNASVADGTPTSVEATGFGACRYTWGDGAGRFTLDVTTNQASRMFSGLGPDQIKQRLTATVTAETADAVIADVGEAAVFKADSALSVHAAAYVKGRILQVQLDGFVAREKKDQVIALLKTAASRL